MSEPFRVAYLAPEMGGVTHTFVHREMDTLQGMGVIVDAFSTVPPADSANSEETKALRAKTLVLYRLSKPTVLARAIGYGLRHPIATTLAKFQLFRDVLVADAPSISDRVKLVWQFCMGAVLAGELKARGVQHLHIHFGHVPTAVGMYAGLLSGIPYSFTVHANDIFVRGVALREKVARSAFCACISQYNVRFLTEKGCDPAKLVIVHCGLDSKDYRFSAPTSKPGTPVLFSVGRLIEKKGFIPLIGALALVREHGRSFHCQIVGGGPLHDQLRALINSLGLQGHVSLLGSQPQEQVKRLLRTSDLFVLPCVVAADGDQDGIPVALMEAMALGVPVISTPVSGIPELIQHDRNGLLAKPRDEGELADCICRLLDSVEERRRLALAARTTIETEFESSVAARGLLDNILKNR